MYQKCNKKVTTDKRRHSGEHRQFSTYPVENTCLLIKLKKTNRNEAVKGGYLRMRAELKKGGL